MNAVKTAVVTLAAAATFPFLAGSALAAESGIDAGKPLTTDFRGRPPFTRAQAEPTADLARFEETDAAGPTESIGAEFSGRPPFKRRVLVTDDASAADFARFEEIDESKPRRRGPPGKSGSRR